MMTLRNLLLMTLAFLLPLLPACDSTTATGVNAKISNRVPLSAVSLSNPDSCDSLQQRVTHSLIARYTDIKRNLPYYCGVSGGGGVAGGGAVDSTTGAPVPAAPAPSNGSVSSDASNPGSTSGTNNQEAGVNEGDILKVDANNGNIFVAQGQYLLVVDAFPPEQMNILNSVDLKAHIINLYYDPNLNNILALTRNDQPYYILASDTANAGPTAGGVAIAPIPLLNQTQVQIFHYFDDPNTAEHEAPQLLQSIELDGYYQDSRRIEGRLHVITRHYDDVILQMLWQSVDFQNQYTNYQKTLQTTVCNNTMPALADGTLDVDAIAANPDVMAAKASLAGVIENIVANRDITSLLPKASRVAADGTSTPIDNYLSCSDVYFPKLDSDLGLQVISSLNSDGSDVEASAIVNNSWQTYVSKDNLYLAENNYYWYWYNRTMQQMSIHKVALSATERPKYLATGLIDGNVGNSFQFSELDYDSYGSVLRVTSTQGGWGIPILAANGGSNVDASGAPMPPQPSSVNHLTLLKDSGDGTLSKISQIRNIAVNETIRSTRFDGTRAFMVTFRQIDPLFTFDLSDPYAPKLAAALKLTGFSSYIHIYDKNHLLTIGRAGTTSGLNGQMQLQLIDITNLHDPQLIASVMPTLDSSLDPNISTYSYSAAEYDHHAFQPFDGDLLAVPVQYNYYSRDSGYYSNFSGIMAYRVTPENGFELLGKVDHSDLAYEFYCPPVAILQPQYLDYCPQGYYVNWASPRRSVFEKSKDGSKTYLYTVSDVGIKAGLLDLSTATDKKITELSHQIFPPQHYTYYYDVVPVAGAVSAPPASGGGGTVTVAQ